MFFKASNKFLGCLRTGGCDQAGYYSGGAGSSKVFQLASNFHKLSPLHFNTIMFQPGRVHKTVAWLRQVSAGTSRLVKLYYQVLYNNNIGEIFKI